MKAELRGVALIARVLTKDVRYENRLVAKVRGIQLAVGVLLQHIKICRVELVAVVCVVAKQAHAEIYVAEDQSPKVADEWLYPCPDRSRVKVRALAVFAPSPSQEREKPGVSPNLTRRKLLVK